MPLRKRLRVTFLKEGRLKMGKHTKGPWYFTVSNEEGLVFSDNCGFCIVPHQKGYTPDEQLANAKLIAAAPDLLEACKEMLSVLEQIDFTELPIEYDSCYWTDWEQAIRKATGE